MKKTLLLSFCLLLSYNLMAQTFSTKTGGHCFNLQIPNYLTKTYDLNDVATLQYKNALKEAYVIVIDDSKDALKNSGTVFIDAKDFLQYFTSEYLVLKEDLIKSEIVEFTSNGNGHAQMEVTWKSENGEIFMILTSVETKEHFYKILTWTMLEFKDTFREDYLKIAKSLVD